MIAQRLRMWLIGLTAMMTVIALIYATHPQIARTEVMPPTDPVGIATWLQQHPADWLSVAKMVDVALDSPARDRFALWYAAERFAIHLAPFRPHPHIAVGRSGLFHWQELSEADRRRVLASLDDLLRDPDRFRQLYQPLFYLTADINLIRRAAPRTIEALTNLERLAVTNGRFADYRSLRDEVRQMENAQFEARKSQLSAEDIIRALPTRRFHTDDDPMLVSALRVLHERPIDTDPNTPGMVSELIDHALRHQLEPLDGLEAITNMPGAAGDPERARLALHLGLADRAAQIEAGTSTFDAGAWRSYHLERAAYDTKHGDAGGAQAHMAKAMNAGRSVTVLAAMGQASPQSTIAADAWRNLCNHDICERTSAELYTAGPATVSISVEPVQTDEYWPYLEIFLDDARVSEGPTGDRQTFKFAVPAGGVHSVEIEIANPYTRNQVRRRVRITGTTVG